MCKIQYKIKTTITDHVNPALSKVVFLSTLYKTQKNAQKYADKIGYIRRDLKNQIVYEVSAEVVMH